MVKSYARKILKKKRSFDVEKPVNTRKRKEDRADTLFLPQFFPFLFPQKWGNGKKKRSHFSLGSVSPRLTRTRVLYPPFLKRIMKSRVSDTIRMLPPAPTRSNFPVV